MSKLKNISLVLLVIFYMLSGANHFRDTPSYIKIIPNYLPYPAVLNILAGFFEILFALLLIFYKTRNLAAWGIILMLIAFLPVHISDWRCTTAFRPYCCNPVNGMDTIDNITAFINIMGMVV